MMRENDCAFVFPDSGEHAPGIFDVTSDFVYVRMHGQGPGYEHGYPADALSEWAKNAKLLLKGMAPAGWPAAAAKSQVPTAVYFFFDNDQKGFAPNDAMALMKNLGLKSLEKYTD